MNRWYVSDILGELDSLRNGIAIILNSMELKRVSLKYQTENEYDAIMYRVRENGKKCFPHTNWEDKMREYAENDIPFYQIGRSITEDYDAAYDWYKEIQDRDLFNTEYIAAWKELVTVLEELDEFCNYGEYPDDEEFE